MHHKTKAPKGNENTEGNPLLSSKRKAPAFQFYATDWLADSQLGSVSPLARGLWIDLLCRMWVSDKQGFFILTSDGKAPTLSEIAKACRSTEAEVEKGLKELERYNIFSKTPEGVMYSRRMLRTIEERKAAIESGKAGGNPWLKTLKDSKGGVKAPLKGNPQAGVNGSIETKTPSSSSTSSSPSGIYKPPAPFNKGGRRIKSAASEEEHRSGFFSGAKAAIGGQAR